MSVALRRLAVSRHASSKLPILHSRYRYSTSSSESNKPPAPRRSLLTLTLTAFASLTAYTFGSIYPPPPLALLFPAPAPPPPSDLSSPEAIEQTAAIEKQLLSLPLLESLRASPDAGEWYEARPYKTIPEDRRVNNLTAGALRGPGKLAVPPVVWARRDESEAYVFIHVGRGLCGHDGIVHGGMLATLLDECMGRNAILNLPERIGVTATLSLSYRAPTKADQFIVVKTKIGAVKGRKVDVSARVEDLNGTVLVEAQAMFVQPRYAKLLNKASIRQVMGEPPSEAPVHLADGEKLSELRKER